VKIPLTNIALTTVIIFFFASLVAAGVVAANPERYNESLRRQRGVTETLTCPAPLAEELLTPDLQDKHLHPTAAAHGFFQSIQRGTTNLFIDEQPAAPCTARYLVTMIWPLGAKPGSTLHLVAAPGANVWPPDLQLHGLGATAVVELVWTPRAPTGGIWLAHKLQDD